MGLITHMQTFNEYIIEGGMNPYAKFDERKLKKYIKAFTDQVDDLKKKALIQPNAKAKKDVAKELAAMQTKLDYAKAALSEGTESLDEAASRGIITKDNPFITKAASRGIITKDNPFITIHVKGGLAGKMAFAVAADIYELPAANRKKVVAALIKGGVGKKIDISKHISGWYDNYKIERLPNPGKVQFALSQHHAKELGEGAESLDEAKTVAQRLKMKQAFRKNKAKIALGRKKASRRLADKDTLMKRARKHARNLLVKKLTKGKDKGELSFAQRQNIEKQVDKKKGAIDRIAKKLLPKLRQADKDKLKKDKKD
jgi:hypothetical protein